VVSGLLRALSICAPATFGDNPSALAQTTVEHAALTAEIPAQPLSDALTAFANQTGLQLVYVSGVIGKQRSHAVTAGLGPEEALAQLLQGTGLRFEYLTPHSIRILAASAPKSSSQIPAADELAEVLVTANRREENLQDVPITVQVMTGVTLAELHATNFDDFVSYLPGVTAHGTGPGQSNIYIRGLATSEPGLQLAGADRAFPNVAVYLDEQSVQRPARNLDVYVADLERIEVLEGPQGTLFGAGAQAGVVRYITNKPRLNVTDGAVDAGYAWTAHGAPSYGLDLVVNLPLITDKLAIRGVLYDERRGGYIDNPPATFTRSASDGSIYFAYAGGQVPANSVVINNAGAAGNDTNSVVYQGVRLEALYQFNNDWSALLTESYQSIDVDGDFAEMAVTPLGQSLPDLTTQLFNPSYAKDRFENTALTIEGRVGALTLLYAGAYLVRNVEQVQDYTNYAHAGLYIDYYQCVNPGSTPATAQCFTPSSTWHNTERDTHESHELRITTPGDWRIRGVGGLYYENFQLQEQTDWFYLTALPYFNPIAPPTGYWTLNGSSVLPNGQRVDFGTPGAVFVPRGVTSNNPNVRPLGDGFFDDITRDYNQKAAYASVDFGLVPQKLTLTLGTRYSTTNTWEVGSDAGSFSCSTLFSYPSLPPAPNPCINRGDFRNLDAADLDRTYSLFTSRMNLSWRPRANALLYYTWSQGFRAGGFNRLPVTPGGSPLFPGQAPYQTQAVMHGGWIRTDAEAYAPDALTNNELGWKTSWFDQHLQWDGALYQEDWNHAQIGAVDPAVFGPGVLTGGKYRVRGLESSLVARVARGLTLEASVSFLRSEVTQEATYFWMDGTPIDFSTLHTATGQTLSNPSGIVGSPLAAAPPFQGNVRLRYETRFGGNYNGFAQLGVVHQSHSLATTDQMTLDLQENSTYYELPPFTTIDVTLGLGTDRLSVQAFCENVTDTHAELFANYAQWYKAVTVNRPRTIGVHLSYGFGGN